MQLWTIQDVDIDEWQHGIMDIIAMLAILTEHFVGILLPFHMYALCSLCTHFH